MSITWDGWNSLLALPPPWAHLVRATERDVDNVMRFAAPVNAGTVIRMIRGVRCGTKQGLLREWAAALQFPYYSGENWDAFEESVNDLEWLPARSYIIVITHAKRVLREEAGFATFTAILDAAATRWRQAANVTGQPRRLPVSFHVVFHCDPPDEAATRVRLREAGVTLATLALP